MSGGAEQTLTPFDTLVVELPDGKRDTETLMIDPTNQDLYIISKREEKVNVYQVHFPYADTLRPIKVLTLPYNKIVAGAISQNTQEVLLKKYIKKFFLKSVGEKNMTELLVKKTVEIPYNTQPQGASICWGG